jgi:hypothetical protein
MIPIGNFTVMSLSPNTNNTSKDLFLGGLKYVMWKR